MVYHGQDKQKGIRFFLGIFCVAVFLIAVLIGESGRRPKGEESYDFVRYLGKMMTVFICPVSGFLEDSETTVSWQEFFYSIPFYQSPLYDYIRGSEEGDMYLSYEMLAIREGSDEGSAMSTVDSMGGNGSMTSDALMTSSGVMVGGDAGFSVNNAVPLQEILPGAAGGFTIENFVPASERNVFYSLNDLRDYSFLVRNFYIVDPSTSVTAEQINGESMLSQDMTIDTTVDGPQILIYHTHSQEAFADSVPGDASTTIVGAGEYLASILEEKYGYEVLHHVASYDTQQHNYAYSYAEPEIRKLLEEYPSIQVVIDLHRDEMAEGTRLVTQVNGQPTAQFMFFNGLSYLNELGHIDYLANPNLNENLAFSFQMQMTVNTYYPGLARRIYLKGYRYNMHLTGKYLLIELGAQNNTVQEIRNACHPLADVLDRVLSGR
ncbi:MAG: stage II sporulation protein P [Lachnospiraceae bacterium]|nr:stage II sporulation protein P [Lachnospiraceae bacterium]